MRLQQAINLFNGGQRGIPPLLSFLLWSSSLLCEDPKADDSPSTNCYAHPQLFWHAHMTYNKCLKCPVVEPHRTVCISNGKRKWSLRGVHGGGRRGNLTRLLRFARNDTFHVRLYMYFTVAHLAHRKGVHNNRGWANHKFAVTAK